MNLIEFAKILFSVILLATGVYSSFRLRFHPQRKALHAIYASMRSNRRNNEGFSPMQTICTSLAGTIGTGNIAGVAGAIAMGGPGVVFWMWIASFFGMATKYTEIVLSHHFRVHNTDGTWHGGPMTAIRYGLGKEWKFLSILFCIFTIFASFGIGNMIQVQTTASSFIQMIALWFPQMTTTGLIAVMLGLLLSLLTWLTLSGGVAAIGKAAEKLVPVMSILYIGMAGIVLFRFRSYIFQAFLDMIRSAFHPKAVLGGGTGISILAAMQKGIGRGLFSNEAGLGSSPIAHASSENSSSVLQGMYGVFEVGFVTGIVCTITALVILLPSYETFSIPYGTEQGIVLTVSAISTVLDIRISAVLMTVCIFFFAFSSILSWSYYGAQCISFLMGKRAVRIYQAVFCVLLIPASAMQSELVWTVSEWLNILMALPNLIAIFLLMQVVCKLTTDCFSKGNGNRC